MFERIARLVHRSPLSVTGAVGLAVALVALGAIFVRFDFKVTSFFASDDPETAALEAYRETWGPDDNLLVVLVTSDEDLLSREGLEQIAELKERIEELAGVSGVESIATAASLQRLRPGQLDPRTILQIRPKDASREQAWRDHVLGTPYVPSLLSHDAHYAALLVEFPEGSDDLEAVRALVGDVEPLLDAFEKDSDLVLSIAGIPAVRAYFFDVLARDQFVFVPVAVCMIAVLLFALFRRPAGVVIPLTAAMLPAGMTIGALGWCGVPVGVINQVFFTLIPVIAIADAIHLVARAYEEHAAGLEWGAAIRRAVRRIGVACLLTSLTTGIGFLSLVSARMEILREFGVFAAFGVASAFVITVLLVPIALRYTRPGTVRASSPLVTRALGAVADVVLRYPKTILVGTGVFTLGALVLASYVEVDNRVSQALDASHPVSIGNALADEHLGGMMRIALDLEGDLGDPNVLAALSHLGDWTKSQPVVRGVFGPAELQERTYRLLAGRDGVPTSRDHIERVYASIPDSVLRSVVKEGETRGRVLLRLQDEGGKALTGFVARLETELEKLRDLGVRATPTGTTLVAYRGVMQVTTDLRYSLAIALGIISITILILFRSLRVALVCLVPNTLPLLIGYAFLGAVGWYLDPVPAVIFTVALGIAVDDTIHLLVRAREGLADGLSQRDALRGAVVGSGRAVTITTVVLVAGLLINTVSNFPSIRILATLGAIVIGSAWVCDIIVLPALLYATGALVRKRD